MNCTEFERALPEVLEGGHTLEQQAHLDSCPACSSLLADLNDISSQAKLLVETDEPSPRVWNAIEGQLRKEGLIRSSAPAPATALHWFPRWRMAWLVPVAAALAIVAGVKLYYPSHVVETPPVAKQILLPPGTNPPVVSSDDQQFLNTVAAKHPARRAKYRDDMNDANAFIRDAEQTLKKDPGDVYAQQMLINAYEQKQMLFDLAVDRTSGQ